MPPETTASKSIAPVIDIAALEKLLTDAATSAQSIVADKIHGRSPMAASLRSNIDHAVELLAQHKTWVAANSPKADAKK